MLPVACSQGVGARFFINFCDLPQRFIYGRLVYGDGSEVELSIESYPVCMIVLLSISYYFTVSGGQIAVVVTDFAQGLFTTFTFLALCFYLIGPVFDWGDAKVGSHAACSRRCGCCLVLMRFLCRLPCSLARRKATRCTIHTMSKMLRSSTCSST